MTQHELKTYIENAIDEHIIDSILEEDSGFFAITDNHGNEVMIYRDLHYGFDVLSETYSASYNEEGKLIQWDLQ